MTPRGGRHFSFRQPDGVAVRCSAGRVAERVDIRADGGYIIVPLGPRRYWIAHREVDVSSSQLPVAPEWLLERIGKQPAAADPACEDGLIPEGRRNATLTSLAGKLRRDGLSAAAMEAALLATDQERCSPPLADEEVVRIAERVSRYAAGTLGREDALATPGSTPHSARQ